MPADGITRDGDGELGSIQDDRTETTVSGGIPVAIDERAGLTAAEAGDRADGEDREVGDGRREVGQFVSTIGERAAVDCRDGDGTGAAIGGEGADVHDRRRGAEVDVAELERREVARRGAEDEVRDREAARGAVAGLDRATVGHVDRAEERAGTAEDGVIGDVGRDVRAGVAAKGKRAAVDVDGDRAGEGAGRSHREGARAGLDELAGARTIDGAAEGAVRTHGKFAVQAEQDRATRGARAFEGDDGLGRAVEVELGARDVRQADDGVRREIPIGASLNRAAVDGGLDGIGLSVIERPHPCPALGERDGVEEVGGQRAVASAGQHEGAVDGVRALRVERAGRAIEREHACVRTQGERAAVGRTKRCGPGVVTGDILQDRGRRGDAGVGHTPVDLQRRASGDDQRGRRAEGGGVRDAEGAGRHGRGTGVGIRAGEGERAEAVLGHTSRTEGHRAADDDVARATEGEREVGRREGATEGERAGIAAEAGGRRDGDRAAEDVVAREILKDTGGGRQARAGDGEGFGGGDITRDLDGRARGDDGCADGGTEGGVIADAQRAFEDLRDARVGRSAGKSEDARAVLIQGERAEVTIVDRTRVGGARHGVGREHRGTQLEAGVGNHAAGAGEGADRGVARAVDVERAAGDGQQAVKARVAAERIGVADTQRAGGDRRATREAVDARDELDAGAGLDEGEVTRELASKAEVPGVVATVGGAHIDRQGRGRGGAVGDGRAVTRDARQAGDGLAETVEVEDRGPGRGDVDDRARDAGAGGAGRSEAVVRAEHGGTLHREEVIVGTAAAVGDRTHARADHLAGSRGDRTGHIERRAVGTEETAGDGGVLDVERTREGRGTGGGGQEDRGFARATGSVLDVDRIRDREAAIQLELGGGVEVDDVRDVAKRGARAFDAEVTGTADVHRTDKVVGTILQDERARADLGHADVAGDLGADREIGSRVGVPDMEHQVRGGRGQRATQNRHRIGAHGGRHQDTAARDCQAASKVERDGGGAIEAERIDRHRRSTDSGDRRAIDVTRRESREDGGIDRVRDDVAAAERGPAGAEVGRSPATEEAAGIQTGRRAGGHEAGTVVDDTEVDRTARLAGDRAEREGRTESSRGSAFGGDGTTRGDRRAGEGLGGGRAGLRGLRERAAAEDEDAERIDERRRGRRQCAVVQRQRAAQERGRAGVVAGAIRSEGQGARAVLGDAARADRAGATVDITRHDAGAGTTDRQGVTREVERAGARDDGRAGRGSLEPRDGDIRGELENGVRLVVEVDERARDRAVDGVANVERVGVIQHQDAAARRGAADVRITEVSINAVELQRTATGLLQLADAVEADTLREDHRVEVRRAIGVELEAAAQDDAGEVRRRADIAVGVGDRGRELEVGIEAEEVDLAIAEDRPGIGDIRQEDAAVRTVLGHARAALVGVAASDRRVQHDGAVGVVRRGAREDEGGIAGDALREGQRKAAATEAVEWLAIHDVREERTVIGQVFVGAKDEASGVGGTEVERFVLGRDAERDRAERAVADLVDDGGLDTREAWDNGAEVTQLDHRRGT